MSIVNTRVIDCYELKLAINAQEYDTDELKNEIMNDIRNSLISRNPIVIFVPKGSVIKQDEDTSLDFYPFQDEFTYEDYAKRLALYLGDYIYWINILESNDGFLINKRVSIAGGDPKKDYLLKNLNYSLAKNSLLLKCNNILLKYCKGERKNECYQISYAYGAIEIEEKDPYEIDDLDDIVSDLFISQLKSYFKDLTTPEKEEKGELSTEFKSFLESIETVNDQDLEAQNRLVQNDNLDYPLSYFKMEPTSSSNSMQAMEYKFTLSRRGERAIIDKYSDFKLIGKAMDGSDTFFIGRKTDYDEDKGILTLSFKNIDTKCINDKSILSYAFNENQAQIRTEAIRRLMKPYNNPLQNVYLNVADLNDIDPIREYDLSSNNEDALSYDEAAINDKNKDLKPNSSQMLAIEKGCHLDNSALLVLGPPGTGKTTVIVDWIKYYVSRGKRVLVTSLSNMAVNNALEGALEAEVNGRKIECVRVGNTEKINDKLIEKITFEECRSELQEKIQTKSNENIKEIENKLAELENKLSYYKIIKNIMTKALNKMNDGFSSFTSSNKALIEEININNQRLYENRMKLDKLNSMLLRCNKWYVKLFNRSKIAEFKSELSSLKELIENDKKELAQKIEKYNESLEAFLTNIINIEANLRKENNIKNNNSDIPLGFSNVRSLDELASKKNLVENHIKALDTKINGLASEENKYSKLLNILEDYKIYLKNNIEDFNDDYINSVDVVGATCIGINTNKEFKHVDFDVVIVDEAGQILTYDVLVPLSKAKENIIMVGDHKQIPPIPSCATDSRGERGNEYDRQGYKLLTTSFFEMLYERLDQGIDFPRAKRTVTLDTQYRIPNSVCEPISRFFYDGKYKIFNNEVKNKPIIPYFKSNFLFIDTSLSNKRTETDCSRLENPINGYRNEYEADIINKLLAKLDKELFSDPQGIGIISAYRAQINLIINTIEKTVGPENARSMCKTLDSFQGQERKIIIYSFTRSNKSIDSAEDRVKAIGFMKEVRRINVALTRCKQQLICVGDLEFLSKLNEASEKDEGVKRFSEFLNEIKKISIENDYDSNNVNPNKACRWRWK